MFRKKTKKGFTLVELVVVIAVIGILAGVSVATYFGVVNSAKESNDNSIVTQINQMLKTDEIANGKPKTMRDTVKLAYENGIILEKYPQAEGNKFVYNQTDNEYYLVDKANKVVFPKNKSLDPSNKVLWKFVKTETELNEVTKDYSVYLESNFIEDSTKDNTLTVKNGFDAGEINEKFTINYENNVAQESTLYTNGGELVVNGVSGASGDTIYHYGDSSIVRVNSVGTNSYHEFGNVGSLNLTDGRIVLENNSKTAELFIESNANLTNTKIEIKNEANIERIIDDTNKLPAESISGKETEKLSAKHVKNIIELDTALYTNKDKYIIFDNDINTNADEFDGNLITADNVIINGNGHKLYGHRTYPSTENPTNNYDYKATLRLNISGNDNQSGNLKVELNNLTIENDVTSGTATTLAVNTFIGDLKLNNVNIINKATNGKAIRFVNKNKPYNAERINVDIKDSYIKSSTSGYSIFNDRNASINATNSTFEGYSAIYMKERSNNSIYNLNNCSLNCSVNYDGNSNDFGTLALATGDTTINLVNCKAQNLNSGTSNQSLLNLGYAAIEESDAKNIYLNIEGDETMIIGDLIYDSWNIKPLPYKITVTGGIYSDEKVTSYIDQTLYNVTNENALYRVNKK